MNACTGYRLKVAEVCCAETEYRALNQLPAAGSPPRFQDRRCNTDATISTSRRVSRLCVAAWPELAISSLMLASFFYVRIGCRDVGFRLVVVVVGHEK